MSSHHAFFLLGCDELLSLLNSWNWYHRMSPKFQVHVGDCLDVLLTLEPDSVDAIVTDPPYGLEFMGKEWDSFGGEYGWRTGAGFSKPGIGDRSTAWPSFTGANDEFGGANPTCAICGGRARGKKKCACDSPDWRVNGEKPNRMYGRKRQMLAFQESMTSVFELSLRVAKPGAHLLAFGGTRTFHRLACALEDAGWEIRDCIMWVYGSGFPKSLDVSKAIDKAAGAEREVIEQRRTSGGGTEHINRKNHNTHDYRPGDYQKGQNVLDITSPATDAAKQWQGWGTALKPAWEPIIVARKPLQGTVASNVQKHGTGAINIDACRVPVMDAAYSQNCSGDRGHADNRTRDMAFGMGCGRSSEHGRWPANLIHDGSEEVVELFPQTQSGAMMAGTERAAQDKPGSVCYGTYGGNATNCDTYADAGSAARFFYCAKASRSERGDGNNHPTVKPLELMRYLCTLVTPPGGIVLDPFLGSGTTLVAAKQDGFRGVGIERCAEYAAIARGRIEKAVVDRRLF